jgi:hypothetical protein
MRTKRERERERRKNTTRKRKWEIGNQSNIMNHYNYVQHKHEQKKKHEIIDVLRDQDCLSTRAANSISKIDL